MYRKSGDHFTADAAYRAQMKAAYGGLSGADVRSAIGFVEGIELQEDEKQAEFKVSYYTEGRHEPFVETV